MLEKEKPTKSSRKKLKIKWKNRYSGETGFVKAIRESKGYFENGSEDEARTFRSDAEFQKAIDLLIRIGEGENNEFSAVRINP